MFHCSAEQPQPPASLFIGQLRSCHGASWDSTEQRLASVLVAGPSRTRLTLPQEHIYGTLLSVIFPSVIQEGDQVMSEINKEKQSWKQEESCTETHAHTQTPLF